MIVLIDNYDSFSYNLYQLVASVLDDVRVIRNDALEVGDVRAMAPDALVLSPGPGRPIDAGICEELVRELGAELPILGVCLGHQAICEAHGGRIVHASEVMHGKSSTVELADSELFGGIGSPTIVGRYHSLMVDPATLPTCLRVIATAPDGEVMAVEHVEHPTFGVQFHPESILTAEGAAMAANFADVVRHFRT